MPYISWDSMGEGESGKEDRNNQSGQRGTSRWVASADRETAVSDMARPYPFGFQSKQLCQLLLPRPSTQSLPCSPSTKSTSLMKKPLSLFPLHHVHLLHYHGGPHFCSLTHLLAGWFFLSFFICWSILQMAITARAGPG